VVPAAPDRPKVGSPEHPMRVLTRAIAFEPGAWTRDRIAQVQGLFDGLAPEWNARLHAGELAVPLRDCFARGGPLGGRALEVGSGTGLGTPVLAEQFSAVVAFDLSLGMLREAPADVAPRVQADAAALPVRTACADAVVLVNVFLFAAEVDRVLAPGGAVVWVNTLAEDTPIHLPAEDVAAALPGEWDGVTAEAGWGSWAVFRRAGQ